MDYLLNNLKAITAYLTSNAAHDMRAHPSSTTAMSSFQEFSVDTAPGETSGVVLPHAATELHTDTAADEGSVNQAPSSVASVAAIDILAGELLHGLGGAEIFAQSEQSVAFAQDEEEEEEEAPPPTPPPTPPVMACRPDGGPNSIASMVASFVVIAVVFHRVAVRGYFRSGVR